MACNPVSLLIMRFRHIALELEGGISENGAGTDWDSNVHRPVEPVLCVRSVARGRKMNPLAGTHIVLVIFHGIVFKILLLVTFH